MLVESPSATYDRFYFQTYRGGAYERNAKWLALFGTLADALVKEFNPRSAIDIGCAKGFLVEALRDRGVEADGVDASEHAIAAVREDVRAHCRIGSILEPPSRRYDLAICMEVVEHLPPEAAGTCVANLCATADDIFFSSTPDDYHEATHLNVQPQEYWASLFAKHGFVRDLEFAPLPPLPTWAVRFRRSTEPAHRQIAGYERRLWELWRENLSLKIRAVETHNQMSRQDEALRAVPSESKLAATVAEQQAHLEALNERLAFMSDTERSLRALLLDAHGQLLQRDQIIAAQSQAQPQVQQQLQQQQALLEERQGQLESLVAHVQHVTREYHALNARIEQQTGQIERQSAQIQQLAAQLEPSRAAVALAEERRETVRCLQAVVDERTAAAASATAAAQAHEHALRSVLMSSSWKVTAPLRLLGLRRRLGR